MAAQERAKEVQQPKIHIQSSTPLQTISDDSMNRKEVLTSKFQSEVDATIENTIKSHVPVKSPDVLLDTNLTIGSGTVSSDTHFNNLMETYSHDSSFYVPLEAADKTAESPMANYMIPNPSAPPLTSDLKTLVDDNGADHKQVILQTTESSSEDMVVPLAHDFSTVNTLTEIDVDLMEFDADGHLLSAEEKLKLIEEQRIIYDRIWHESQLNDAAIAAAQADTFDERVNVSMSGPAALSTQSLPEHSSSSALNASSREHSSALDVKAPTMVDIGGGKKVSLYGTERTLDAIKEGTAILVQCISCNEWMQVTSSATLMYCPKCNVVSEVVRQEAVKTKEEAIRLTLDRKMASEMQERENQLIRSSAANTTVTRTDDEESTFTSYLPSFIARVLHHENNETTSPLGTTQITNPETEDVNRGNASQQPSTFSLYPGARVESRSDTTTSAVESRYLEDMSLWNYFSSMLSSGSSSLTGRSAEIGVSRPPSTFHSTPTNTNQNQSSKERISHTLRKEDVRNSDTTETNDETERLLPRVEHSTTHTDANIWNSSTARVGDRHQPILACVADSISHTAMALGSVISSRPNNDVDGVDRTSLLVQGQAPSQSKDDSDEADGSYRRLA